MEIGLRLFVLSSIVVLAIIQSLAWLQGFNGQLTVVITGTILTLIGLITGIKINPQSIKD